MSYKSYTTNQEQEDDADVLGDSTVEIVIDDSVELDNLSIVDSESNKTL
jgi:hypothetical protein